MPRTVTPEEQERVNTISELKNVKPTPQRKVFVDSDADGKPNIFLWDPSGEASNADGTTIIESGLVIYGNGGTKEGVWRRFRLPFSAATTDDLTEGSNNLYYTDDRVKNSLSAGGDITYTPNTGQDGTPAEFSLDVSSLSASDLFGSKTTDDLPEGSSNLYFTDERAQDAVGTAIEGANGVTVTYDDANDKITVDASTAGPSVSDDGNQIIPGATDINFSTGLEVADDGDGTVTVSSLSRFGTATFSADGSTLEFEINHGLNNEPEVFVLQPKSDDASALSHATADSNTITAIYDTPPPSGTDNVVIDYSLKKQ
jgi:hypothetical protein